jgi:hypothetical protein
MVKKHSRYIVKVLKRQRTLRIESKAGKYKEKISSNLRKDSDNYQ